MSNAQNLQKWFDGLPSSDKAGWTPALEYGLVKAIQQNPDFASLSEEAKSAWTDRYREDALRLLKASILRWGSSSSFVARS